MDDKAISLLNKIVDRSSYRAWNDRLINALSQVIDGAREVMKYLMKCAERNVMVGSERKWTHSATDALAGIVATATVNEWARTQSYQQWNEDLYCILVDKCDGEAYSKVKTVQEGDGIAAYCIIHRYFTEISGYGTTLRAQQLIFPPSPKTEGHIAECVDKWLENVRSFEAIDKSYYLAIPYKVEALRCLMAGPRANMAFEYIVNAKRIMHIDEALRPEAFTQMINAVKEFAQRARLEELSKKDSGINNAEAPQMQQQQQDSPQEYYWPSEWDQAQWNGEDYEYPVDFSLDALGKGKAKSKGKGYKGKGYGQGKGKGKSYPTQAKSGGKGNYGTFQGYCGYCHTWGHRQSECRKKLNLCFQCGKGGHAANDCTSNPTPAGPRSVDVMQSNDYAAGMMAPPGIIPAANNQPMPNSVTRPMGSIELGGGV